MPDHHQLASSRSLRSRIQLKETSFTSRFYKMQQKRIQKLECRRLKKMIPSLPKKSPISQVTVIEEAIKHITRLEEAVRLRLQAPPTETNSLPPARDSSQDIATRGADLNHTSLTNNLEFHQLLMRNLFPGRSPPSLSPPPPACRPVSVESSHHQRRIKPITLPRTTPIKSKKGCLH